MVTEETAQELIRALDEHTQALREMCPRGFQDAASEMQSAASGMREAAGTMSYAAQRMKS